MQQHMSEHTRVLTSDATTISAVMAYCIGVVETREVEGVLDRNVSFHSCEKRWKGWGMQRWVKELVMLITVDYTTERFHWISKALLVLRWPTQELGRPCMCVSAEDLSVSKAVICLVVRPPFRVSPLPTILATCYYLTRLTQPENVFRQSASLDLWVGLL